MAVFSRLPVELLDAVLREVEDFDTLIAAALSHRRWRNVYYRYRASIDRAVLDNNMKPSVRAVALRSIRLKAWLPTYQLAPSPPALVAIVKNHFHESTMLSAWTITDAEYDALIERARVSDRLERVYSRRYKDRLTQRTSRLSPAERELFHISLHRLWLLSLFAGDSCIIRDADNNPRFRKIAYRMDLFYTSYTAQQLYHQHLVISWMEELVYECQPSPEFRSHFLPDFIRMRVIANGPDWVLRVLKTPQQWKTLTPVVGIVGDDPAGWKRDMQYFFRMSGLLNLTAPPDEIPPGIMPIVAPSAEPDLQCWRCTARPGTRLWNEENWGYLPLNLRLDESFAHWLPGSLNANRYEQSLLFHYLGIADPNAPRHTDSLAKNFKKRTAVEYLKPAALMTMPRMMQALCDLDPRPQNARDADSVPVGPDEFAGVTSKSLLCQECLAKMVMARLWVWWQREKDEKSKTELDKGNCWFGYECILQGFKADHASRLNHTCRNTWVVRKIWRDAERARRRADDECDEAQVDFGLCLEGAPSVVVDDDAMPGDALPHPSAESASVPTTPRTTQAVGDAVQQQKPNMPYLGLLQLFGIRSST